MLSDEIFPIPWLFWQKKEKFHGFLTSVSALSELPMNGFVREAYFIFSESLITIDLIAQPHKFCCWLFLYQTNLDFFVILFILGGNIHGSTP